MKTKLNPALAGMFVLGTFVLVIVALLSFRTSHLFSKPGRFVAYFNESVQGLDIGSAVKLRGVRVGRVVTIKVQYDAQTRESQVIVVAELDQNVLRNTTGQMIKITERATLVQLINQGLRAKIDLAGITGQQYIELDFADPAQLPATLADNPAGYPVVPTVHSGMSNLIANVSQVVSELHQVDFAEISRQLKVLLTVANQRVGELDVKTMITKITSAAESVETLAGSSEAKAVLVNLNKTATDAQKLVAKLDTQVEPVQVELVQTLRSFRDAAQSAQKLLGSRNGLGDETIKTLRQIADTAESLQRLADFLERNPNALITGKKRHDDEP